MNIYLIGYMGSGKTTLGKKLANALGYAFVDMDGTIEEREGMSVSQIFADKGESYFREQEQALLQEIAKAENQVVSTGGGTPCFFDNINLMNRSGATVYLKAPAQALMQRITCSPMKRPLLQNQTCSQMLETIYDQLDERKPYYEQAQYTINALNCMPNDIIKLIEK